ncbi:hypothetical protein [Streptacidiphilus rugosus]|uniref:hypothetical protein n=1 Tax=Streptacidiphilus rugosus TaxID=405783 RepID=UPI000690E22C|nr:hypothetical protein [Streptacidiphilus rugosus]
MADTTIKVSTETRDRLATLAAESGTSIGHLVTRLSKQQFTAEEVAERVARTRQILRESFGMTLTDEELDAGPNVLTRVYEIAAEDARAKLMPHGDAA